MKLYALIEMRNIDEIVRLIEIVMPRFLTILGDTAHQSVTRLRGKPVYHSSLHIDATERTTPEVGVI